jgi:hypothetical protein
VQGLMKKRGHSCSAAGCRERHPDKTKPAQPTGLRRSDSALLELVSDLDQ